MSHGQVTLEVTSTFHDEVIHIIFAIHIIVSLLDFVIILTNVTIK